jgi:hypothetical protein
LIDLLQITSQARDKWSMGSGTLWGRINSNKTKSPPPHASSGRLEFTGKKMQNLTFIKPESQECLCSRCVSAYRKRRLRRADVLWRRFNACIGTELACAEKAGNEKRRDRLLKFHNFKLKKLYRQVKALQEEE